MATCSEHGPYLTERGCPTCQHGKSTERGTLLDELALLRADQDRLASLLERARQAMDEGYSCPRCGWMPDDPYPVPRWGPCDICADARDLLTEMDTPHEEGAEG